MTFSTAPKLKAGVTLLGKKSEQTFGNTQSIPENEIDQENKTQIFIRLVVAEVKMKSTPYPARLD